MKIRIKFTTFLAILISMMFSAVLVLAYTSPTYTIVSPTPANLSTQDNQHDFNFSFNTSTVNISGLCVVEIGLTNGTLFNASMTNSSGSWFYNSSNIHTADNMTESKHAMYHNYTFVCDVIGNGTDISNDTSSFYQFKVDLTNPATTPYNFTITNNTAYGFMNISFMTNDTNIDTCNISLTLEDGTTTWYSGITGETDDNRNCSGGYFGPVNLTQDGDAIFTLWANDTTGTRSNHTNVSYIINNLKVGWNIVSFTGFFDGALDNKSANSSAYMKNVIDIIPNCSIVSRYHEKDKNYTTYAISTPSINNGTTPEDDATANTTILMRGNATWLYCNTTAIYIRPDFISKNTSGIIESTQQNYTLTTNITATGNSWNLMSLWSDLTLNATMQPRVRAGHMDNIKAVSWYNTTIGHHVSCVKTLNMSNEFLCTAGWNASQVQLTKATAVWINVNATTIIDRLYWDAAP